MQPQNAYLESQIQTAAPLELVCLLYRAARDATRSASAHLAAGRNAERSNQISKAFAILTQLSRTLDHARGGKLSHSLAELYDYMQRRLLEANQRQKVEPLVEVGSLLATLLEGWDQIRAAAQPSAPNGNSLAPTGTGQSSEYGGYAAVFAPATAEYASQSWSF
ncbi:MAG: flagellar export chaperone FliS [Bryobacteraceae bacterium]|jgi:flagellar protein FliS